MTTVVSARLGTSLALARRGKHDTLACCCCWCARAPTLSSDGSVVYVGSNDYSLYAINTNDGSKRWAFQTGGAVSSSPTLSSDGSAVYVGSEDDSLWAINTHDGSKRWAFQTGNTVWSSPTLSSDGSVVYGAVMTAVSTLSVQ